MAKGNRAAINVATLNGHSEVLDHSKRLGGKCFVKLEKIHIIELPSGLVNLHNRAPAQVEVCFQYGWCCMIALNHVCCARNLTEKPDQENKNIKAKKGNPTAKRVAGMGPVPMMDGSTPACAHATMHPSEARPRRAASSADMSTTAAAPSLIPLALPGVTVPLPSVMKQGRSFCIVWTVLPLRGYSSVSTVTLPATDRTYPTQRDEKHTLL
eukprot:Opistho-2@8884